LSGTNTLAYFAAVSATKEVFIIWPWPPGVIEKRRHSCPQRCKEGRPRSNWKL